MAPAITYNSFASSSSALNDYLDRAVDQVTYYVTLSTNTKESNKMYKSVDLTHQTDKNRKDAAEEAKRAAKTRKATAQVETSLYGGEPFATVTLQNDAGQTGDDSFNPRYMSVRLSAEDLEKFQDAIYAARVELHKHTTQLKNPKISDFTHGW